MTMEIYSGISYGNVYVYTFSDASFADEVINARFADKVASEAFLTCLVL